MFASRSFPSSFPASFRAAIGLGAGGALPPAALPSGRPYRPVVAEGAAVVGAAVVGAAVVGDVVGAGVGATGVGAGVGVGSVAGAVDGTTPLIFAFCFLLVVPRAFRVAAAFCARRTSSSDVSGDRLGAVKPKSLSTGLSSP